MFLARYPADYFLVRICQDCYHLHPILRRNSLSLVMPALPSTPVGETPSTTPRMPRLCSFSATIICARVGKSSFGFNTTPETPPEWRRRAISWHWPAIQLPRTHALSPRHGSKFELPQAAADQQLCHALLRIASNRSYGMCPRNPRTDPSATWAHRSIWSFIFSRSPRRPLYLTIPVRGCIMAMIWLKRR